MPSDDDCISLSQKAGCLLALSENTLDELKRTSHYQLFTDGKRLTAIYFKEDAELFDDFINDVRNQKFSSNIRVCFQLE
jgi:hypothetical protein